MPIFAVHFQGRLRLEDSSCFSRGEIHGGTAAPLVEFHPTFCGTTSPAVLFGKGRETADGERRTEGHRDKTSGTGETPV